MEPQLGKHRQISDKLLNLPPLTNKQFLVGGVPTPLKNMSSSVGMSIPKIWKFIKFHSSKPPSNVTSLTIINRHLLTTINHN